VGERDVHRRRRRGRGAVWPRARHRASAARGQDGDALSARGAAAGTDRAALPDRRRERAAGNPHLPRWRGPVGCEPARRRAPSACSLRRARARQAGVSRRTALRGLSGTARNPIERGQQKGSIMQYVADAAAMWITPSGAMPPVVFLDFGPIGAPWMIAVGALI